jgi:signal transduction histidine kinase
MNSSPVQDVSLYELALNADQPVHALQVSPAILKSMVSSLIDVLVDQQISATLWVKLPQGEPWQAEVERYRQLAGLSQSIYYLYNPQKDEAVEEIGDSTSSNQQELPSQGLLQSLGENQHTLIGTDGTVIGSNTDHSSIYSIQLAPESQLKREYFLLVLSEQFSGIVLGHRPRSMRQPKLGAGSEADLEKKQPLLALCSFSESTLQPVLEGLKQAIACSLQAADTAMPTPAHTTAQLVCDDLLSHWDSLFTQFNLAAPDLKLLNYFLAKQIQRQEEVWRRATTYRKQAETTEALQVQNTELLNALRLKDEFLNNLGQEMRTPLTNMKTALTLLNSPNLKPPQRQRYMQLLLTECDHQSSLINGLLDLVQLDQIDQTAMQPLRLIDIVPGVVSTYQPLAQEKGVMLAYTVPEELPPVLCLSAWLKQIVINLLHNGVKFTPTGGQVWVRAKQQGDYIQLEFRDTGIGIPTTEIPKIFDRFYRVRTPGGEDAGGAGLGLTIVQQLLLRSGGSISVKSRLTEGSTFNVLLPIYPGAAIAPEASI